MAAMAAWRSHCTSAWAEHPHPFRHHASHTFQPERVIGERHWADGTVKYLVKWRGLPYCESTYETKEGMEAVGQGRHVDEFQVSG